MAKILPILLACCLAVLACDTDKNTPTAMQLIQGTWTFNAAETLQQNSDLAQKAQQDPEVAGQLGLLEKSYILILTPLALLVFEGSRTEEYSIRSVSDDGHTLVLAIQPKDSDTPWVEYIFAVNQDTISVDIPNKGIMVFQRK